MMTDSSLESRLVMDHFYQHIPRPSDATRLEGTAWPSLVQVGSDTLTTQQVISAFSDDAPDAVDVEGVEAAVLVGIVDRAGEPHLLLTRRALHLDRDPGLMALPGGYVEPGEDPLATAVREAEEEVGLYAAEVDITSCLGVFSRSRTGLKIAAYLGWVDSSCQLRASADEVHEIFEVPLATLIREGSAWREEWHSADEARVVHFFADAGVLGDNLIWGLTAAIIWRLLERLEASIADLPG